MKKLEILTLLCYDTRIVSKCTATRIKNIFGNIIDIAGNWFIEGRFIGEGIRHLLEIGDFNENENFPETFSKSA